MKPHDDGWVEHVSLHADSELPGPECAAMQDHLAQCELCRAALQEFRQVKTWLATDSATEADRRAPASWPQTRAMLRPRRVVERIPRWQPVLLAASIVLAAAIGGTMWTHRDDAAPRVVLTGNQTSESRATLALEHLVRVRLAALPPTQAEPLASSLRIIDGAIADARAARAADPTDYFVATYLDDLLKRRIDALRKVVEITNAEAS